jgi:hypothetical protein
MDFLGLCNKDDITFCLFYIAYDDGEHKGVLPWDTCSEVERRNVDDMHFFYYLTEGSLYFLFVFSNTCFVSFGLLSLISLLKLLFLIAA